MDMLRYLEVDQNEFVGFEQNRLAVDVAPRCLDHNHVALRLASKRARARRCMGTVGAVRLGRGVLRVVTSLDWRRSTDHRDQTTRIRIFARELPKWRLCVNQYYLS